MDIYSRNIYYTIQSLSDLERQKKSWLGSSQTDVSSFNEDYSLLFDSFGFEDFLTGTIIVDGKPYSLNLNDALRNEMAKLKSMLESYLMLNNGKKTDKEILEDSEWYKIVGQAKKVIKVWDGR